MADTKISALAAATAAAGADEIPINEAGTTKKLTVAQLAEWIPISVTAYTSRTADITISGLAGNTDCAYKIIMEGRCDSTGDYYVTCKPNNDTTATNYVHSRNFFYYNGGATNAVDQPSQAGFSLGGTTFSANTTTIAETIITAKARGLVRSGKTDVSTCSGTDKAAHVIYTSIWKNTADEITSLVITFPSITFTGTISIYKKA